MGTTLVRGPFYRPRDQPPQAMRLFEPESGAQLNDILGVPRSQSRAYSWEERTGAVVRPSLEVRDPADEIAAEFAVEQGPLLLFLGTLCGHAAGAAQRDDLPRLVLRDLERNYPGLVMELPPEGLEQATEPSIASVYEDFIASMSEHGPLLSCVQCVE